MKQIREIINTFQTSRPIFKVQTDGQHLILDTRNPIYAWRPVSSPSNGLEVVTVGNFEEHFNVGAGRFHLDKDTIAAQTISRVRRRIARFLELNLKMKAPRQSSIYRWVYREMPQDDEFNSTIEMVYKYICSFCNEELKSTDAKHKQNAIAIIEALQEKYGKK